MPKSRRAKVVSLTKVAKKTKENKAAMMKELQDYSEKCKYCWLFEVGAMRNAHLKTVRRLWKDSARIFFGRAAVMAKALGTTPEEEHRMGIHKLSKQIKGQVGLLFTDWEPQEVIDWFADFKQPDFARAGNIATRTIIIPAGPVMRHHSDPPEPFPHNEEPQLRKLGLSTSMNKGVPTLQAPHKLCEKGKALTSEQAQLLKLIGEKMVTFRVGLLARWDAPTGEVTQIEGGGIPKEEKLGLDEGSGEDGDMSEALPWTSIMSPRHPTPPQPLASTFEPKTDGIESFCHEAYARILETERQSIAEQKTETEIAPLRVLGYLLQEQLAATGINKLAKAINNARDDLLIPLGRYYIKYFIRIFRRNEGPTPQPSNHSSRESFDTALEASYIFRTNPGSLSRAQACKLVLDRDDHRSLITRAYSINDISEVSEAFHRSTWYIPREVLEAAHIIPAYLANLDANELQDAQEAVLESLIDFEVTEPSRAHERSTVWNMLQYFGGSDVYDELAGNLIHSSSNLLTLGTTQHHLFGLFCLWFEPTEQYVDGKQQWKVCHPSGRETLRARGVDGLVYLTSFSDKPLEGHPQMSIPAPNSRYLGLHAACCRVAWMSGAAHLLNDALSPRDSYGIIPSNDILRLTAARLQYDFEGPKVLNKMKQLSVSDRQDSST
ncbi:hypothetical protein ONZ45_g4795 [Pleurotus djamor]|nr:hypothetical protein ONZ45_g4795 [Pleurotus djamor]